MSIPRRALLAAVPASLAVVAAQGQGRGQERASPERGTPPAPRPAPGPEPLPAAQTRDHALALRGRTLRFSSTAGSVTLTDGQGTAQAAVAYIAYTLEGAAAASRPVTFVLNGGPGAASAWLQLGALGPWRLDMEGAAARPSAPVRLADNEDTWLDFTDLVFIDPVGAGYSRFLATGEDLRKRVWSVGGDIDAVAGAIRRWLVQAGRMASAKFYAGESYGGFRGPRLARALAQSHGVGLSGMTLISPVLDFGGRSNALDPLYYVSVLPTLVAATRHATSRAEVADAEEYAAGAYLADLLRGTDPAAVARRSERVAALTGLDPVVVRRAGGMVDAPVYLRNVPPAGRDAGRLASMYDLDVSLPNPDPTSLYSRQPDAILDTLRAPFTAAMVELYASRLGWKVDAPFEVLNETVSRSWDWGGGGRGPAAESMSQLRTALALDPALRVLVAHGLYDAVTPYFHDALLRDTIEPAAGRGRVALQAWAGGHMMYSREAGRAGLRAEAARLYS